MHDLEFDRVPDGSWVKGMLVMAGKASIPTEKVKPLAETAAACAGPRKSGAGGRGRLRLSIQFPGRVRGERGSNDNLRKSSRVRRQPTSGKWSGAGSVDHRRDVLIDLLRKSG